MAWLVGPLLRAGMVESDLMGGTLASHPCGASTTGSDWPPVSASGWCLAVGMPCINGTLGKVRGGRKWRSFRRGGSDIKGNMEVLFPNHHLVIHPADARFDWERLAYEYPNGL